MRCGAQGYVKNEAEWGAGLATGGWLRTGDAFRRDAARHLYYCRRLKFCFKYNNLLVSSYLLPIMLFTINS
jgi:long-subunit acyl-CoA synthetase (AMP-forming)